jgi:hypothetical protein
MVPTVDRARYHFLFLTYLCNLLCEYSSDNGRPRRSNRGQGGALAQLASAADRIRPDLDPDGKVKRSTRKTTTKEISSNVPVNPMAPQEKQRRGVRFKVLFLLICLCENIKAKGTNSLPVGNDLPLTANVPKPLFKFAIAKSFRPGPTFGFQSRAPVDHAAVTHNGEGQDQLASADERDGDNFGMIHLRPPCAPSFFARTGGRRRRH